MSDLRALAPATYCGIQPGFGDIELWTLTAPVGEHPAASTVSRETLEAHGYRLSRGRGTGMTNAQCPMTNDKAARAGCATA